MSAKQLLQKKINNLIANGVSKIDIKNRLIKESVFVLKNHGLHSKTRLAMAILVLRGTKTKF